MQIVLEEIKARLEEIKELLSSPVITEKASLAALAIQEFHTRNVNFVPLYPAVLIRVLPKRKVLSTGIILTDAANHKPLYEGIVLRVYAPRTVKVNNKQVLLESDLEVGDHILFPHWSGESVPWLNNQLASNSDRQDDEYRLIPSRGALSLAGNKEVGEPFLKLNYEKESVQDKFRKILDEMSVEDHAPTAGEANWELFEKKLREEFDIIPKVKSSKMTSGT